MSFVVIAYPKISYNDFEWIQKIREENDPIMYGVVNPHVTLLFPTSKLNADELYSHVLDHLDGLSTFNVVFDSTKVVEDDSKTYTHTFLIPSEGFNEINKLHDQLYTDNMASELRLDIPFIPHLGIGTDPSRDAMMKLSEAIAACDKAISGVINELVVSEYDGKKVTDLRTIPLKSTN